MKTFIRTIVLTIVVIMAKTTKIKPNKKRWDRKWTASEDKEFKKKMEASHKRFKRMKPEQQKVYVKSLMNRGQKKQEIKKQIIEIISTHENLALADIREKLGLHRNTFNYWVGMLEEEGWFKRKTIEGLGGKDKRGSPKTLILNKKLIEKVNKLFIQQSENYEEEHIESSSLRRMVIMNIMLEIVENPSYNQHKGLTKLFKEFNKDEGGSQMTFLLSSDFIKLDYKFSLTDKGKNELEKLKKK